MGGMHGIELCPTYGIRPNHYGGVYRQLFKKCLIESLEFLT